MVTPFQEAATQVKGLLKADGRILRERWIFLAISIVPWDRRERIEPRRA